MTFQELEERYQSAETAYLRPRGNGNPARAVPPPTRNSEEIKAVAAATALIRPRRKIDPALPYRNAENDQRLRRSNYRASISPALSKPSVHQESSDQREISSSRRHLRYATAHPTSLPYQIVHVGALTSRRNERR